LEGGADEVQVLVSGFGFCLVREWMVGGTACLSGFLRFYRLDRIYNQSISSMSKSDKGMVDMLQYKEDGRRLRSGRDLELSIKLH
jgi:hypothetical protein